MAVTAITAILAVSLTVAAKAQYLPQLHPGTHQQEFTYTPEQARYFQPGEEYESLRLGHPQQTQNVNQGFDNGATSTSTFNYGTRRISVQVNHHDSEAFVNNYNGPYISQDYSFNSIPGAEVIHQVPQNYQHQNEPDNQNRFNTPNDFNRQEHVPRDPPYTITNPINGHKYEVEQPIWDPNAYNLNIHYNTQQTHQQTQTTVPPPQETPPQPPPPPPPYNFNIHYNTHETSQTQATVQSPQQTPAQPPPPPHPYNFNIHYNTQDIPQTLTTIPSPQQTPPQPPKIPHPYNFNIHYNTQETPQTQTTITSPQQTPPPPPPPPPPQSPPYNFNIHYNTQQTSQIQTTVPSPQQKQPPPPPPPHHHNFQYNNDYVLNPNYFEQITHQNVPFHSSYNINSVRHYSNPQSENAPSSHSPNTEYIIQRERQFNDFKASTPIQPVKHQKESYFRPSLKVENSNFIPMINRNKYFHTSNDVQPFTELPNFESSKIVTKQKFVKNFTVVKIDEELNERPVSTPPTVFTRQSHTSLDLPVVKDFKAKVLPTPAVFQPTKPSVASLSQHFNNLVTVPDYSSLFRSQPIHSTQQTSYGVPHNYKLYITSTSKESSTPSTSSVSRYNRPGGFFLQSTPKPFTQTGTFYQPTTPQSIFRTKILNEKQLTPNFVEQSTQLSLEKQTIDEINSHKKETLLSVNGFEEYETTTQEESPHTDNPYVEHTTDISDEEIQTPQPDSIQDQPTHLPFATTTISTIIASNAEGFLSNTHTILNPTTIYEEETTFPVAAQATVTESSENISKQTSPLLPISKSSVTRHNLAGKSKHNLHYRIRSSTTPTKKIVKYGREYNTEREIPLTTETNEHNNFESSKFEKDQSKRRKKIRVFKKPLSPAPFTANRGLINDRTSKNIEDFDSAVSDEQTPIHPTESVAKTKRPQIHRGRYHATIPQRDRNQNRPNVPHTGFLPTAPQPEFEYDKSEEQPVPPTASQPFLPTIPRTQSPSNHGHQVTFTQETSSVVPTLSPINQVHTEQTRKTLRPRPFLPTIIPEDRSHHEHPIMGTHIISTTEKTLVHESTEEMPPTTTELEEALIKQTTTPEPERSTLRSRTRLSQQRGHSDSTLKHEKQIYTLHRQNLNGRLRVISPSNQDHQPLNRRQYRYHDLNHQPHRQVVRKIIIKPNQKVETASDNNDQHLSGSYRASYRRNQAFTETLNKKAKESTATVRNAVLFAPRKPLRSRFTTSTTTEKLQEISTEALSTTEVISLTEVNDKVETTVPTKESDEAEITENIRFDPESTTVKFTGKRQIETDPDVLKLVEDSQNLEESGQNFESQEKETLTILKEIAKNIESAATINKNKTTYDDNIKNTESKTTEEIEHFNDYVHTESSEMKDELKRQEELKYELKYGHKKITGNKDESTDVQETDQKEISEHEDESKLKEILDSVEETKHMEDTQHFHYTPQHEIEEYSAEKELLPQEPGFIYEKEPDYYDIETIETKTDKTFANIETIDEPMAPEIVPSVIPQVVTSEEPLDAVTRIEIVTSISEMRQIFPNKIKYKTLTTEDIP